MLHVSTAVTEFQALGFMLLNGVLPVFRGVLTPQKYYDLG